MLLVSVPHQKNVLHSLRSLNNLAWKRNTLIQPQPYKYFLVMDIEATCDQGFSSLPVQEILEFPVLKVNSKTFAVESIFHEFVRPRVYPQISEFCTSLTGIIQQEVDNSPYFPDVLAQYLVWHKREVGNESFLPVTCGDWDLLTMLPRQCALDNLPVPQCFRYWHNIKMSYYSATKDYSKSLKGILTGLKLERTGRPHRGIDDCVNVKNIVCELIRRGQVIVPTKCLDDAVP